jgi:2-oxoglutarate ferredoxin oxidoreductase subunit delta
MTSVFYVRCTSQVVELSNTEKQGSIEKTDPKTTSRRRKGLVRVEINENLCKGCDICIEFCPADVFEKSNKLNHKGYYLPIITQMEECNGCRICDLMCPEFAIVITIKDQ